MNLIEEIERSLPTIERLLTKETLLKIAQSPPDDLEEYAIDLGPILRIRLLNSEKELYKSFVQEGIINRDKMVSATINEFHKYIQNKF